MQYTFIQLIFLFFVYSFLGWIFDMTVAAIRYGKILNRGFLNGPLSIQYGIIMIIVLLDINDLWDYPLYQFITCMVIVFMTEYASGAILKRITGRRFWDYSDMKLNVGGYTCAFSVLGWGFTAAVTVWLINPLVCIVYSLIPVNVVKVWHRSPASYGENQWEISGGRVLDRERQKEYWKERHEKK